MCAISGFVDFNHNTSLQNLEVMNRTMAHRGPDGEGYNIYESKFGKIGLAHRRLSIIDFSEGGSQPMNFQNLHITYNGEIYNFEEIKKELQILGYEFESNSDIEVILHSFKEWGAKSVEKFIGMFAFVIYGDINHELFACKDRAVVKPFFYYFNEGLFLFSSELKAIVAHPSFDKKINNKAIVAYMQFGYVPTPHCIFSNTFKLKSGHTLNLKLESEQIKEDQYWNVYDLYNKPVLNIDLPDAILETQKLLKNAFQCRIMSDVPVGVFLGGGYFSSCVTALLQVNNIEKIKTFTIGIPDVGLNEASFAKEIAEYLDTDHTEHYCTEKEALEIIPQLPFIYDEPFADSSAIPTTLVSIIAKQKATVALSADSGDEIFAGYSRYQSVLKNYERLNEIPSAIRKPLSAILKSIKPDTIPGMKSDQNKINKYMKF